jgi:hypothetical protein
MKQRLPNPRSEATAAMWPNVGIHGLPRFGGAAVLMKTP